MTDIFKFEKVTSFEDSDWYYQCTFLQFKKYFEVIYKFISILNILVPDDYYMNYK